MEKPTPAKRERATLEVVKFAIYLATLVVGGVVFVFVSQAAQDARISDNAGCIKQTETRHEGHVRQATETFAKLDRTLTAQQDLLARTREAIAGLEVSQRQVVDEVRRMHEEVRRGNP